MQYISISEAARRWGVTARRVQDMCRSGVIKDAVRFGRAWMLPENTQRPPDGRTRDGKHIRKAVTTGFLVPPPRENPFLLQTNLFHTPGTADAVVAEYAQWPETQRIMMAQLDYQKGNIGKIYKEAQHFLKHHQGFYSVISAAVCLSKCALWKGDAELWRQARLHIYNAPAKTEEQRQILLFWLGYLDSSAHDTNQFPQWAKNGDFSCLPPDSYPSARVFYLKNMLIAAQDLARGRIVWPDVTGLGLMRSIPYIAEPLISQAHMERTVLPEIYLRLMAAVAYHDLGEDVPACHHIDKAIELCLPDGLYTCLAAYRSQLDTLLDERLSLLAPQILQRVKSLQKQFDAGWIKLHNALLGREVNTQLTAREREVAKLAAFGLSNSQIAARLSIEVSSVKHYIFSAMNKVGADKRTELGLYV